MSWETHLFPAAGGGYWLLGNRGAYVRLDDRLARADAPGPWERVELSYRRLRVWHEEDDSGGPWRQRLSLPVLLLFPPVAVLLALGLRRAWPGPRARIVF